MPSIAIIGAGVSGLAAAHTLHDAGYTVSLFEQSGDVGGRATTRQQRGFIYDHGAQYIKGGSPVSDAFITKRFRLPDLIDIAKPVWIFDKQEHIQEGDPLQNADPKWTYRSGLIAFSKRMAEGLDIQLETPIGQVERTATDWNLFDMAGYALGTFDQLLITIPATSAAELIYGGAKNLKSAPQAPLRSSTDAINRVPTDLRKNISSMLLTASYNPLISVMLGHRPTPQTRPYYALVNTDKAHPISWLAWEHEKTPERAPEGAGLLIAQMAPQYSREHWQDVDAEIISDVTDRVAKLIDEPLRKPVFTDISRWRYALPITRADGDSLNKLTLPIGLAFCGDAFVGGRVHLALEHGILVAQQLIQGYIHE